MSLLPESLRARTPRPRPRGHASRWIWRLMALGLAFLALQMVALIVEHLTVVDAGDGPPAGMATVAHAEVRRGGRGYQAGWVTFQHGDVTSKCMVPVAQVDTLRPGQVLPYWIEQGFTRTLTLLEPCAGHQRREGRRIIILFGVLVPLLGAGVFFLLRHDRRHHRLLTEGPAAAGVVTSVGAGVRGGVVLGLEVEPPVSFTGTLVVSRRRLKALGGGRMPTPGDRVFVVHDPQRPATFALWSVDPVDA